MSEDSLQLWSFEVNEDNIIDGEIHLLRFPNQLKEFILKNFKPKDKEFTYGFALRGLKKIVMNYSREVVYVNNSIPVLFNEDNYWIYSASKFDLEGLIIHINKWINDELKNRAKLKEEFFLTEDLTWGETITIKGIFKRRDKIYSIIPVLYIRDLCKDEIYFESVSRAFMFFPIIKEDNSIASAISEVIFREGFEPYSYEIKLALKKPYDGENKLYLNVSLASKLWATKPFIDEEEEKNYVSGKQGTSLYIFKKDEFTRNQTISFIQTKFVRGKENFAEWKNSYDMVYAEAIGIDINEIVKNPGSYMDFNENLICLVSNKNGKNKTKRGTGLGERLDVFEMFKENYNTLLLRERIQPVKYNKFSKVDRISRNIKPLKKYKINKCLKNALNTNEKIKRIIFYVYSSNKDLYEAAFEISKTYLEINKQINPLIYLTSNGFQIEFKQYDNNISRMLTSGEDKYGRALEIINGLEAQNENETIKIALVDIPAFHENKGTKKLDSKNVVRYALKNNNTLTQFINGYKKEDSALKLSNALADLFFAANFLNDEFYKYGFDKKILLGIDLVPECGHYLLAISKIENGITYYKLLGEGKWQISRECIYGLSKARIKSSEDLLKKYRKEKNKEGIDNWICDTVQEVIDSTNKEINLYLDCSLRSLWKFPANDNYIKDKLKVIDEKNLLRIIRVNNTDDIPSYSIGSDTPNRKKGIFTNDYKTFYMVGARGDTNQANKFITKYDNPDTLLMKQRLSEIVILGASNENEGLELGQNAYALRKLIPTYNDEVMLPLPLYVIERLREYVCAVDEVEV